MQPRLRRLCWLFGTVLCAASVVVVTWRLVPPSREASAWAPKLQAVSPQPAAGRDVPDTSRFREDRGVAPAGEQVTASQALCDELISRLEQLVEAYPEDPQSHSELATAHFAFCRMGEAERVWRQCLEQDPRFLPALAGLVRAAQRAGRAAEAVARAREFLAADPQSADAHNLLAFALIESRQWHEALEVLQQNLQLHPDSPQSHNMAGKALLNLERYEEAQQHFKASLRINPGYVHAYYGLGTVYAKLGQRDKSKEALRQFKLLRDKIVDVQAEDRIRTADEVRVRRTVAGCYAAAALVHVQHDRLDLAEALWAKGASVDPKHVACREALAELYRRQVRIHDCVAIITELTHIEPENPDHFLNLGTLYGALCQFDETEAAFQKVCELAPDKPIGFGMLAQLYLDSGRKLEQAPALARRAVEREPTGHNQYLLARACLRNGDREGARAAMALALQDDPDEPQYQHLHAELQKSP